MVEVATPKNIDKGKVTGVGSPATGGIMYDRTGMR